MTTTQLKAWQGKFGTDYTKRNSQTLNELDEMFVREYGASAREMFQAAVSNLSINTVLEVGCNIGNKLALLYDLGYRNLTGVEPQQEAIELGIKRYPFINFKPGTIFNLPFADRSFDLVFTSGVLIHIAPVDLAKAISEIIRVSKRFVLGFEYFSKNPQSVFYRGKSDLLWKRDFAKSYQLIDSKLSIYYRKKYYHRSGVNSAGGKLISEMFVIEKPK